MKPVLLFLFIFLMSIEAQSQDKIIFEYDSAGNQIVRRYCPTCSESKNSQNNIEDELLKFFPEDVISYYPNPVKDILYFNVTDIVLKIEVYDIYGRILSSNSVSENKVDLSELKTGNYMIKLYTKNGITNTKIIKE